MNRALNFFCLISPLLVPLCISGIDLHHEEKVQNPCSHLCISGIDLHHEEKVQNPCSHQIERRVAFDIGSGQIKMQVSDVDINIGKLANVLFTDSAKVALREDLVKSLDGHFSSEIENKLVEAIKELMKNSEAFHPQAYHAVATESFRLAKNGNALADQIKRETGLSVTIISQEEEGVLGFISATNEVNVNPEKVVSWDFGGGSFQLTTKFGDQFCVYQGKVGKIPFRNALLHIQDKDVNQTLSPNPVSRNDFCQALEFIKESLKDVPLEISQKLNRSDVIVLGIGIHPLWGMENNASYGRKRIIQEIERRFNLNDQAIIVKDSIDEIHKDSAAYIVSNLILAYGIMTTFSIDKVDYVGTQGANAIGTLLSPKYWKNYQPHK